MFMDAIPTGQEIEADRRVMDAAYYRGILHGMIDVGALLVAQIGQHARKEIENAGPDGVAEPTPEVRAAYVDITRSMRRSVLLAQKLDEPVRAPRAQPAERQHAARRRIIRAVEDAIQRESYEDEVEDLETELLERLEQPEMDDEIDSRPVDEIITDICRDLGLVVIPGAHPWKRRTPEDIAALCEKAAGRGGDASRATSPTQPQPDAPSAAWWPDGPEEDPPGLSSETGCRGP